MKQYQLFLDESGQFIEKSSNGKAAQKPGIVAGYLAENRKCNNEWAKKLLQKTKESSSSFSEIKIDPFHGMEDRDPHLPAFITALLQELCKSGSIRLVEFKNKKGLDIVNSDITYLNVLTEGIIQLIVKLLAETDEKVCLDILYAVRVDVTAKEASNDTVIQFIDQKEYTKRLEERLALQMAALPDYIQNRFSYSLQCGNAKKDTALMIADAVCGALRGFKTQFSGEQRQAVRSLKTIKFSVLDHKVWQAIEMHLMDKQVAQAVYQWYSRIDDDDRLQEREDEFKETVITKLKSESLYFIQAQLKLLSETIGSLINGRNYTAANIVMDHLIADFFPLLEDAGIEVDRSLFDIHFYRLTTCTHQGTVALGNREMQICDACVKTISWNYEDLEYLLSYKLRKVEQQKNAFDFTGALDTLTGMEKLLDESLNVITLVDDLGDFSKNIRSQMLGKVMGSKVAVEGYLLDKIPDLKQRILTDSDKAIFNFTDWPNLSRQYQTRAMAEYKLGNYEEAVRFLKKSAGLKEEKLMVLVRKFKETNNVFGLMHYANVMALASADAMQFGKELYDAWNQEDPMDLVNGMEGNYPKYVIQWRVATTRANLGVGDKGEAYYKMASMEALQTVDSPTIFAAGLSILAEFNGMLQGTGKPLKQLKKKLSLFMESDAPQTMKEYFAEWDDLLYRDSVAADRMRKELLLLSARIPVL